MVSDREAEYLEAFDLIERACLEAIGRGEKQATLKLRVDIWLWVLNEIKNRQPRNYSQLIRDELIDRLNAAIDRLQEQINYLIAHRPGLVADAFVPSRLKISDELKDRIKRKD